MLFGVACFTLYAGAGLVRDQPGFTAWRRGRLALMALVALASGAGWLALTAAGMSGAPSDATSPSAIASVVTDTAFGKLWAVRMAGCGALLLLPFVRRLAWLLPITAAAVLASLAWTGHGGLPDGTTLGRIHTAADAAHLLAAGAWIGALWALGWMVLRLPRATVTSSALSRFSGVGQLVVAVLIATGIVNAYVILGHVEALWTTRYGRLLALKLLAFAGMLALAGLNRWVLTPRLAGGTAAAASRLRWHILCEQALSFVVLGVVAVIGTSDPAA